MEGFTRAEVIMTGSCAAFAACELAAEHHELLNKRFPKHFLRELDGLSVLFEADYIEKQTRIFQELTNRATFTEVGNRGIYTALWDLCSELGCGITAELQDISISSAAIEVCELFDRNPYELSSKGCWLLVTREAEEIRKILCSHEIQAAKIAVLNEGNDRIVRNGERIRFLP